MSSRSTLNCSQAATERPFIYTIAHIGGALLALSGISLIGLIEMTLQQVPGQQEALITIRDQGIPEAEQAQLFGRFSRASNGENQGISGTGLGLYLCHELVSQHGGDIWFESTEGVGSTFFLRLPLLPDASRHGAMESSSALCGEQ